jgi:hypothetical protein
VRDRDAACYAVCDSEMTIAVEMDSRDSIDMFAMILEEVLMRNFVRCEQDSWPENARSRCCVQCTM